MMSFLCVMYLFNRFLRKKVRKKVRKNVRKKVRKNVRKNIRKNVRKNYLGKTIKYVPFSIDFK